MDDEHEKRKQDKEHRREGLRTGQRKKTTGEGGYDRLVEALHESTTRNLQQSGTLLEFEQERHEDAMQLAHNRLLLKIRRLDSRGSNEQKKDNARREAPRA